MVNRFGKNNNKFRRSSSDRTTGNYNPKYKRQDKRNLSETSERVVPNEKDRRKYSHSNSLRSEARDSTKSRNFIVQNQYNDNYARRNSLRNQDKFNSANKLNNDRQSDRSNSYSNKFPNSSEPQSFSQENRTDLIWGRHACQAALEASRPIHRIWCTAELRSSSKFFQLLRESKSSGVLVEEVSWARLGQITNGAVHQGISLQIAAVHTLDLKKLIEACNSLSETPLLLALDGLTDPHNVGAIVRSAEALGAHGLVLPQRRSAGLTGSVAKVAAGALEHLPVARVINLNRSLCSLKESGYRIIGLAEEGDAILQEVDLDGPLVVVVGSEDKGLSLLTRKHCDHLVRIPLRGITPSLNASIATSLVLYEIARNTWMKRLSGQDPSPKLSKANLLSSKEI